MQCNQVTVFSAGGEAIIKKKQLPVSREADQKKHVEAGVINVYPQIKYQTIEGFGAAMTESSAYLLSAMAKEKRQAFLNDFFGKEGNSYKYIRTHMDSCDFSLSEYQAVENPIEDLDFTTFSIERDRKYIIPVIKEAIKSNNEWNGEPICVLLSPWSPPYQWKTVPKKLKNDAAVYGDSGQGKAEAEKPSRNHGGSLKPEYYEAWARYLVKYVSAYLKEGIPVTMMTMQNESIAATNWDSCVWTAKEQKKFLIENLYPEFKKAGLLDKVGIFIWDHNKERMLEWSLDLIDEETRSMIVGIAFHWYSGDHFEAVQMTHELFPEKTLMLSECCVLHKPGLSSFFEEKYGYPKKKTSFHAEEDDARAYAHDIIGNLNAGMNRWIDWNFCVDENGGPRHVAGGFGAGTVVKDGNYVHNMTHYYIGQFTRYIKPGAKRIGFSRCDDKVELTAVENQDGSVVMVLLNRGAEDGLYTVRICGNIIPLSVPKETISTVILSN